MGENMTELLSVQGLSCLRYNREIFSDIDFVLPTGSLLIVQGANGSGKSSLLRILATLLEPLDGVMLWRQKNIQRCRAEYRDSLFYVGHKNGVKEGLTVQENLKMSRCLVPVPAAFSCQTILRDIGLGDAADVLTGTLSAGQQRRLSLARLLLAQASLWLLDEPFSALDGDGVMWANSMISSHCHRGGGVIMALHDGRAPADVPVQRVCL